MLPDLETCIIFCWVILLILVPVLIVVTVVMTVVLYLKCSKQDGQTNSPGLPGLSGLSGFLRFRNVDDYSAILDVPISDFVVRKDSTELEPKKVTNVTAFSHLLDLQNGNYNKFSNNTIIKYKSDYYPDLMCISILYDQSKYYSLNYPNMSDSSTETKKLNSLLIFLSSI